MTASDKDSDRTRFLYMDHLLDRNMREDQYSTRQFVKVVEKYPILYIDKVSGKNKEIRAAWKKVAEEMKRELKQECTVQDVKSKWRRIRVRFTSVKKKLYSGPNKSNPPTSKYYLYDLLAFLHPYTEPKFTPGSLYESSPNEKKASHLEENNGPCGSSIKAEPLRSLAKAKTVTGLPKDNTATSSEEVPVVKTESLWIDVNEATSSNSLMIDENLDSQFFNSILPDIAHFTSQEKRTFKMGVLKLIDEIEENRI